MDILIGLDIGTSRIKAVATDTKNNLIAEHSVPTPWNVNQNFTDIDVVLLANTAIDVIKNVAQTSNGKVLCIGITGFAETGVLIDEDDQTIKTGLAWHDTRGLLEPIKDSIKDSEFMSTTGLSINTTTSLAKTLWLKENNKQLKHFMSIPEWVAYCLGAEVVNEVSLLSRTGFFDVVKRQPWEKSIKLVSDNPNFLGKVVIAGEPVGIVKESYPELSGATITIAGHDHLTAAYYSNAIVSGTLFDSIGTAEAILCTVDKELSNRDVLMMSCTGIGVSCSVIENHYTLIGAMNTGLALDKFFNHLEIFDKEERIKFSLSSNDTNLNLLIKYLVANSNNIVINMENLVGKNDNVIASGGWIKNPILLEEKQKQFSDRNFSTSDADEAGAMGAAKFASLAVSSLA